MKYTLIDDTFDHYGRTLHRIKALKNFGNVKAGDIGGYVQSLDNLSQDGNCWIYDDARVFDNVKISDNAIIYGDARVFGDAKVYDDAIVYGNARVYNNAEVFDNARIFGNVEVCDCARVYDDAIIYDDAKVSGYATVFDDAIIFGNTTVSGNARVYGDARVFGDAEVSGYARIFGDSVTTSSVQSVITHKHNITITDNNIIIGCQCHSIEHWQKNINEIGKKHGYSKREIKAIKYFLNAMLIMRGNKC